MRSFGRWKWKEEMTECTLDFGGGPGWRRGRVAGLLHDEDVGLQLGDGGGEVL